MVSKTEVWQKRRKRMKKIGQREIHIEGTPENLRYDLVTDRWFCRQGVVEKNYEGAIPFIVKNSAAEKYDLATSTYQLSQQKHIHDSERGKGHWYHRGGLSVESISSQKLDNLLYERVEESLKHSYNKLRVDLKSKTPKDITHKILGVH